MWEDRDENKYGRDDKGEGGEKRREKRVEKKKKENIGKRGELIRDWWEKEMKKGDR